MIQRAILTMVLFTGCSSKSSAPVDAPLPDNIDAPSIDAPPDAFPCPDEHGAYTIALTGAGCGDFLASAPECISQAACTIAFASNPSTGGKAMNGSANLGVDGAFTGAAITEGTSNRTGCVGTWDAGGSILTVDCGGVGSSQSCRAMLTRTSLTCP